MKMQTSVQPVGMQVTHVTISHLHSPLLLQCMPLTTSINRHSRPLLLDTLQAGIQNAATASAAIGAVNVIGTVIAGSMIEKAGRVQLLTVSFTGMCISMFAMVAGRCLPQLASSAGTIAFAGTVAYVLSFALGAGPVPGLLVPEINTEQMRGEILMSTGSWLAQACMRLD